MITFRVDNWIPKLVIIASIVKLFLTHIGLKSVLFPKVWEFLGCNTQDNFTQHELCKVSHMGSISSYVD